jgi:hypothetical protein
MYPPGIMLVGVRRRVESTLYVCVWGGGGHVYV